MIMQSKYKTELSKKQGEHPSLLWKELLAFYYICEWDKGANPSEAASLTSKIIELVKNTFWQQTL